MVSIGIQVVVIWIYVLSENTSHSTLKKYAPFFNVCYALIKNFAFKMLAQWLLAMIYLHCNFTNRRFPMVPENPTQVPLSCPLGIMLLSSP